MSDGGKGMMENHSGARPTHDLPDSFLHLRPIAMDGAFLAGRLVLTVTAPVKSSVGIIQQPLAAWA